MPSEQIVRELLDENDMAFTTKLNGRDVDVYHGAEWMDANADVSVEWILALEARDWGVKAFEVSVRKVTAYLHMTDEHEQEHEEVVEVPSSAPEAPAEGDVRAELAHYGRPEDYQIKTRFNSIPGDTQDYIMPLYPRHAEIDMRRRVIEISF